MIKLELEVNKLVGQIAKLASFKKIAERHMRSGAKEGLQVMSREWAKVAPQESGRYKGNIKGRVKSVVGLDVTGIVGANVNNRGYPYPRLLEFSPKHHYRSTGRAGQGTAGQAKKAVDGAAKEVFKPLEKALARVARDIIFK